MTGPHTNDIGQRPKTAPDGRDIGRLTHVLIARLAQSGDWSPRSILRAVGAMPEIKQFGGYQQAARQRIATSAGVYRRWFLPDEDCHLEAFELTVPGGRLDLLWRHSASGRCWADEVKTHSLGDYVRANDLHKQLSQQADGGEQTLDGFLGVRACLLSAPRRSELWHGDGSRERLQGLPAHHVHHEGQVAA